TRLPCRVRFAGVDSAFYLPSSCIFCGAEAAPPATDPLSLHDALPISLVDLVRHSLGHAARLGKAAACGGAVVQLLFLGGDEEERSEEHTSELQSRFDLVCRLLLEKKQSITTVINPSRITLRKPRGR